MNSYKQMKTKIIAMIVFLFLSSCGCNEFTLDESTLCISARNGKLTSIEIYTIEDSLSEYYIVQWNHSGKKLKKLCLQDIPQCYTILNRNRDTVTEILFSEEKKYIISNKSKFDATSIKKRMTFKH